MNRLQNWPEALHAYVDACRPKPLDYGTHDCATFAAAAVQIVTGEDVLGGLMWSGEKGALRQLEVEGGLEAAVTSRLGEPIPIEYAQRGDVVLAEMRGRYVLGVCLGDVCAGPGIEQLEFYPTIRALKAWGVGRG